MSNTPRYDALVDKYTLIGVTGSEAAALSALQEVESELNLTKLMLQSTQAVLDVYRKEDEYEQQSKGKTG